MNLHQSIQPPVGMFLVEGRVDWDNARLLDDTVRDLLQSGISHLVFHLETDYLASSTAGMFVYYLRCLRKKGGGIYFVGNNTYIRHLFKAIGFETIFRNAMFQDFQQFVELVCRPIGLQCEPPHPHDFETVASTFTVEASDTSSFHPPSLGARF